MVDVLLFVLCVDVVVNVNDRAIAKLYYCLCMWCCVICCVVRMSELMPDAKVLTVDSDFFHYRKNSRHSIAVIHPRR